MTDNDLKYLKKRIDELPADIPKDIPVREVVAFVNGFKQARDKMLDIIKDMKEEASR